MGSIFMEQSLKDVLNDPEFFRYFQDETSLSSLSSSFRNIRMQRHSQREIMLVISGETTYVLNGQVLPAIPGSVFFIDSWVSHQLGYPAQESSFDHVWLHFHQGKLFASLLHWSHTPEPLCRGVIPLPFELYPLLNRRWNSSKGDQAAADGWKNALQRGIIRLLCEEFALHYRQQTESPREKPDIVEAVENYIAVNCGRNSSLEALEKFSGYNRFYLTRLFRRSTGYTIGDYKDQVRRQVVNDARSKQISDKEIAWQLGFSSPAAFSWWKKQKM